MIGLTRSLGHSLAGGFPKNKNIEVFLQVSQRYTAVVGKQPLLEKQNNVTTVFHGVAAVLICNSSRTRAASGPL